MNEKELLLLARLLQIATKLVVRLGEQAGMTEDELFERAETAFATNEEAMVAFLKSLDSQ